MKERLRRIILFAIIVITGSVMILMDIPLILLIPLIFSTGFVALMVVGGITVSDISSIFKRPEFEHLKKIPILKRLDEIRFFEKPPGQRGRKIVFRLREGYGSGTAKKTSPASQVRSLLSSFSSLGTVIREQKRHQRKVEHINELLDKTVSEKVKGSALAGAAKDGGAGTAILTGSDSPGLKEQEKDQDPFMSLSRDEFDISLLDSLEDAEPLQPSQPGQGASPSVIVRPDLAISEPDIPLPSLDIDLDDRILLEKESGLEEFSGLEGIESVDLDFKDLDTMDFTDGDDNIVTENGVPETVLSVNPSSHEENGALWLKNDRISSDGSSDARDREPPGSEISSPVREATHLYEDLLSSLASDVRYVKKERDLSLLRELKDFKAPANEIDNELKETYERLILPEPKKLSIVPRQSEE
jgi:hypothetical protein